MAQPPNTRFAKVGIGIQSANCHDVIISQNGEKSFAKHAKSITL
jgi:hypothetical protein